MPIVSHRSECYTSPANFKLHHYRNGRIAFAISAYLLLCAFRSGGGKRKMLSRKLLCSTFAVLLCLSFSVSAAEKKSKDAKAEETKPSYELAQPATENLDYTMYQRIRSEGLSHSHVMEFASALMDGIGPRLTGSPNLKRANEWTRDQLAAMGCSNAHLEDWGEFGMGWQQLNTWTRMASPDPAVFIPTAAPWSPSSNGTISGQATWMDVKKEEDLDKYKGKLGGKVVLLGDMRDVKPVDKPLFEREDEKDLAKIFEHPLTPERDDFVTEYMKRLELREKVAKLLASEHALAVILPSRDGRNNGGSGGTIFVDSGGGRGWVSYKRDHIQPLPVVIMASENYGRSSRLLKPNVPVTIEMK